MFTQIIALGWFACVLVDAYADLCWKKNMKLRKPFSCQKCMGFWLGIIFGAAKMIFLNNINAAMLAEVFVFALLTSFAASIEYALIRRI